MSQKAVQIAIVDLDKGRFGEIFCPDFSELSERHTCNIDVIGNLEPASDVAVRAARTTSNIVLVVISRGLPQPNERKLARGLFHRGIRTYFYWPRESAVELIDNHRIKSYRNHAAFFNLLSVLRVLLSLPHRARNAVQFLASVPGKLMRQVAINRHLSRVRETQTSLDANNLPENAQSRRVSSANQLLNLANDGKLQPPTKERPIAGTGAYVRLEFWSQLKTGGSYGHTCFLAKAAASITENFKCIFAHRFDLLDNLGVQQILLPNEYTLSAAGDLIFYGQKYEEPLARELDKLKPAYVYERIVLGSIAAAKWCESNDIPYIVEYNGSELAMARSFGTPYANERDLRLLEDYSLKSATLINAISEPIRDDLLLRGLPTEKILVNPNGVDAEAYQPSVGDQRRDRRAKHALDNDHIVVGFCGTFGGWHGIEVLAEALPQICKSDPRVRMLLIGDGNLKHLIHQAVLEYDLGDQVIDLGLIPHMEGAEALSICDILLSPHAQNIDGKTFFGSPTKLFEYLAVGAAVVASDLAQLGEVMRPSLSVEEVISGTEVTDERGVLIRPGCTRDLIEAVRALVASEKTRSKLGANAREAAVASYTWDIHVRNIFLACADLPLEGYAVDADRGL